MGKVLQYEKRETGRSPVASAPNQSADILMFTGVRYERQTAVAPTKPTASPGHKRKRG